MKGSLLLGAALCALGVIANPIDKRVLVTDIQVTVVTVTITETPGAASTTLPVSTTSSISTTSITAATEASAPQVQNEYSPVLSTSTATDFVLPSSTSSSLTSTSATTVAPQPTTTAISSSPTSTTSTSPGPAASGASAYQAMILDSHNIHRANQSASDLVWNATLAESALALANTCSYGHNTDLGPAANYGQNIGFGIDSDKIDEMITNLMYNGEMMYFQDLYGQANPSMSNFDHWGHFSQIVWVDTTSVGCATVTCDPLANSGSSMSLPYTVCNYYPAGNYAGEYADNVLEPLGHAMVVAS